MATNLVSVIMKFLTPDMISRMASALGLDRNDASSAVEAGVPALLAAFAGVAANLAVRKNLPMLQNRR
jgi:hypothetical protein